MTINRRSNDAPKVELINFKDHKKFADVAHLVDREEFLKDILTARSNVQRRTRTELPIPWEPRIEIIEKLWEPFSKDDEKRQKEILDKAAKNYHLANITDTSTKEELEELRDKYESAYRINPSDNFWLDVKKLRQRYNQSLAMEKVIAKAILNHEVHDEDYSNCYVDIIYPVSEYPFITEEPLLVMILSPSVKQEEVENVYNRDYKLALEDYQKLGFAPEIPAVDVKAKSMIIRDRELYWLYSKKHSFTGIAEEIYRHARVIKDSTSRFNSKIIHNGESCIWCQTPANDNDILKAITSYDRWLHRS